MIHERNALAEGWLAPTLCSSGEIRSLNMEYKNICSPTGMKTCQNQFKEFTFLCCVVLFLLCIFRELIDVLVCPCVVGSQRVIVIQFAASTFLFTHKNGICVYNTRLPETKNLFCSTSSRVLEVLAICLLTVELVHIPTMKHNTQMLHNQRPRMMTRPQLFIWSKKCFFIAFMILVIHIRNK